MPTGRRVVRRASVCLAIGDGVLSVRGVMARGSDADELPTRTTRSPCDQSSLAAWIPPCSSDSLPGDCGDHGRRSGRNPPRGDHPSSVHGWSPRNGQKRTRAAWPTRGDGHVSVMLTVPSATRERLLPPRVGRDVGANDQGAAVTAIGEHAHRHPSFPAANGACLHHGDDPVDHSANPSTPRRLLGSQRHP